MPAYTFLLQGVDQMNSIPAFENEPWTGPFSMISFMISFPLGGISCKVGLPGKQDYSPAYYSDISP